MESGEGIIARIGMVDFIIAAPIYETWKRTVVNQGWQLTIGSPAVLRKKLAEGALDMGFVSTLEYGAHPEKYSLLSGLSLSTTGVAEDGGSVFLFSHVPPDQLDETEILLCPTSETSGGLVKIILEDFFRVNPVYKRGEVTAVGAEKFKAVLAIGDDALRIAAGSTYLYQLDLANIWKRETGLPFVFAVFAVRQNFCLQQENAVVEIHKALLRCRDEGSGELKKICDIVASRIPMSITNCCSHLKTIEYDLDDQKQKSLTTFFEFLIKRGEMGEDALPLNICSNLM